MKSITFLALLLFTVLFFLGAYIIVYKALAYDISKRVNHYRLIIYSTILALLFSNPFSGSSLLKLADYIITLTKTAGIFGFFFPQRAFELGYLCLCLILLNALFALSYIVLISIYKLFVSRKEVKYIEFDRLTGIKRIIHWPWYFINKYYYLEDGKIKLKVSSYSIGHYISGMKYACAIVWFFECAVIYFSVVFGTTSLSGIVLNVLEKFYLLPVSAFFVFVQLQLFFEGPEDIIIGSKSTVEIEDELIGQVDSLIPRYQETFGDAVLCSEFGSYDNDLIPPNKISGISSELLEKCNEPELLRLIVNQIQQSQNEINDIYLDAIAQLINGKSVFVKDNIEGEFSLYYTALINYHISQGKSALFLCSDEAMVNQVKDELSRVVCQANGTNLLWVIASLDELNNPGVNVVVCTYNEFIRINIKERYGSIFTDSVFAVFPDAIGLISQNNVLLELLRSKLKSLVNIRCYIFISNLDNSEVSSRIGYIFSDKDFVLESYNNDKRYSKTGVMIWKGESRFCLQGKLNIGDLNSPYLGVAIPLSLLAIRNDFPRIHLVKSGCYGDESLLQNAKQSHVTSIKNYLGNETDFANKISVLESDAIMKEDLKILCVYDEEFNFFSAIWKWFKYAGKNGTLIHVISPFYMMREFFADNYKCLLKDFNQYMALYKDRSILDNSRRSELLAKLSFSDMEEDEVSFFAKTNGYSSDNLNDYLLECVTAACAQTRRSGFNEIFDYVVKSKYSRADDIIEKILMIRMTNQSIIDSLIDKVALVEYKINNTYGDSSNVLKENVYNYFLEGQIIPYCGNYYTVDGIKDGIVSLLLNAVQKTYDYFQISSFEIVEAKTVKQCVDDVLLDFNILQAQVKRNIYGYVSTVDGNDFYNISSMVNTSAIGDKVCVSFPETPILEIKIRKEHVDNDQKVIYLLSTLLNGLFKTLFPLSYQNIFAVADLSYDTELCDEILNGNRVARCEDLIRITTPGIINHAEDNDYFRLFIIEFSSVEYGMVNILYENRKTVLKMVYRYLNWYLATLDKKKGKYLNYGMPEIPTTLFSPVELLKFLIRVLPTDEPPIVGKDDSLVSIDQFESNKHKCTFCGRTSYFAWKFADGRISCGHCYDHMNTHENEIVNVYDVTFDRMNEYYGISLPEDITIRFQSKDAIERVAGKMPDSRTLGFYSPDDKELWIERKGPTVAMQSTMAHELTHSWQYKEFEQNKQREKRFMKALGNYKHQKRKVLLEGHAVFVQIDTMKNIFADERFADVLLNEYAARDDAYGVGYRLFKEYFDKVNQEGRRKTPFEVMTSLINDIIDSKEPIAWPPNIEEL